jgi:hypothetical protein
MDLLEALPEVHPGPTRAWVHGSWVTDPIPVQLKTQCKGSVFTIAIILNQKKEEVIVSSSEKSDKIVKKGIQQLHSIMEKFDLSAWKLSENCQL